MLRQRRLDTLSAGGEDVRVYGSKRCTVARFFGVTTSLANRYVVSGELLELRRYA